MESFTVTSDDDFSYMPRSTSGKQVLRPSAAPFVPLAQPVGKTVLCGAHIQSGACMAGVQCPMAHCLDELDPVVQQTAFTAIAPHVAWVSPSAVFGLASAAAGYFSIDGGVVNSHRGGNSSSETVSVDSEASSNAPTRHRDGSYQSNGNNGQGGIPIKAQSQLTPSLPSRCRYPHPTPGNYYEYLNIKRSASKADVANAYDKWRTQGYNFAKRIDSTKANAMDRLIVEAKLVLGNEALRREYDALLPE